jgi:hypothetical protein
MMEGFRQDGAIDEPTMREFDDACLTPAGSLEAGFATGSGVAESAQSTHQPC